MSASPAFAVTPRTGRAVLSAATTDWSGATTANIVDILTGAASGTKIEEIGVMADGNPADSIVIVFVHNGTDYRPYDYFDLADPAASSVTIPGYREFRLYGNLYLPSASFKLAAAITAVPTSGSVVCWSHGADL